MPTRSKKRFRWFEAGIDFLLSRIKDKSKRRGISVVTHLLLPIGLCIGVPALVAVDVEFKLDR